MLPAASPAAGHAQDGTTTASSRTTRHSASKPAPSAPPCLLSRKEKAPGQMRPRAGDLPKPVDGRRTLRQGRPKAVVGGQNLTRSGRPHRLAGLYHQSRSPASGSLRPTTAARVHRLPAAGRHRPVARSTRLCRARTQTGKRWRGSGERQPLTTLTIAMMPTTTMTERSVDGFSRCP